MTPKEITVKVSFSKKMVKDVIKAYQTVIKERGEPVRDPTEKWLREFLRKYAQRDALTVFAPDEIHSFISKELDNQTW